MDTKEQTKIRAKKLQGKFKKETNLNTFKEARLLHGTKLSSLGAIFEPPIRQKLARLRKAPRDAVLMELFGIVMTNLGLEIRYLKSLMEAILEGTGKNDPKQKPVSPFEWLNTNGGAHIVDQVRATLRAFVVALDLFHTSFEKAPLYNLSHTSFVLAVERLFQERAKLGFFPGIVSTSIHKFVLGQPSQRTDTPGGGAWRQEVAKLVNKKLQKGRATPLTRIPRKEKPRETTPGICRFYNSEGGCARGTQCRKKHVCLLCHRNHPLTICRLMPNRQGTLPRRVNQGNPRQKRGRDPRGGNPPGKRTKFPGFRR